MRHRNRSNHLGRTASHRAAMLSNMATSLILHKRIKTTLAKAREIRKYVEPLITKSKRDTTHSRRTVFSYLQNKYSVKELFTTIAPQVSDRPGGYIRILKLGPRNGDGAEMALVELVDFNEFLAGESLGRKKKAVRKKTESATSSAKNTPSEPASAQAAMDETSNESTDAVNSEASNSDTSTEEQAEN